MTLLDNSQIAETLKLYYAHDLPSDFCHQVRTYINLLLRWNRRISLTTVVDPLQILRFHFGESLFAISQVPIRLGRLADVGSGAGFPAVPIRMALEGVRITLIESNRKKFAFLSEVARELGLTDVNVHLGRMEDINHSQPGFDFVTARAVAIDDAFLMWSSGNLKPGGAVALWLGQDDSVHVCRSMTFDWRAPARIPRSERRVVLVGTNPAASSRRST